MLKKLTIPVPPIQEQHTIAAIDEQQRQYVSSLATKQLRLETLKGSLMHDLFTGHVRLRMPLEDIAA
jgi:restriction endonuclease S subunit